MALTFSQTSEHYVVQADQWLPRPVEEELAQPFGVEQGGGVGGLLQRPGHQGVVIGDEAERAQPGRLHPPRHQQPQRLVRVAPREAVDHQVAAAAMGEGLAQQAAARRQRRPLGLKRQPVGGMRGQGADGGVGPVEPGQKEHRGDEVGDAEAEVGADDGEVARDGRVALQEGRAAAQHRDEIGAEVGEHRDAGERGIAVAAINYRFSPLPDPVYDAARAIQYLRAHAKEYNLDKTRFAATGFSAGATTSLWLALHDDLADPKSKDPVLRESTRLKGAYILGVQSSIDPVTIRSWKIGDAIRHQMICRAAGFKSNKEMDAKYETKKDVYKEFSPITHASKDDPEVMISARSPLSNKRDWIHHPVFGYEFKKHADKVGALCDIELSDQDKKLVPPVKDRNGYEFLVRVLTK